MARSLNIRRLRLFCVVIAGSVFGSAAEQDSMAPALVSERKESSVPSPDLISLSANRDVPSPTIDEEELAASEGVPSPVMDEDTLYVKTQDEYALLCRDRHHKTRYSKEERSALRNKSKCYIDRNAAIKRRRMRTDNDVHEFCNHSVPNRKLQCVTFGDRVCVPKLCFAGFPCLNQVMLSDTTEEIGEKAFEGCENLNEVKLSSNLVKIGTRAFADCRMLKLGTLPCSVIAIGDGAFDGCSSLTEVTLPVGLRNIGKRAFRGCTSMEKITLPDKVTTIDEEAFVGCESLKEVTLPRVDTIKKNAFAWCEHLERLEQTEYLANIGDYAFYKCKSLQMTVLPYELGSIGVGAFAYCTGLSELKGQEILSRIGVGAFEHTKLEVLDLSDCWSLRFDNFLKRCKRQDQLMRILDNLFWDIDTYCANCSAEGIAPDLERERRNRIGDKCKVFLPKDLGNWEFDAKSGKWKPHAESTNL
ncbi:MAG: leucine-rich repeat domain-containing protein [Holosporales bacterium]|nr:leucine-rich repeat domain-containing protein [Holosporales bacterium]